MGMLACIGYLSVFVVLRSMSKFNAGFHFSFSPMGEAHKNFTR